MLGCAGVCYNRCSCGVERGGVILIYSTDGDDEWKAK